MKSQRQHLDDLEGSRPVHDYTAFVFWKLYVGGTIFEGQAFCMLN